MTGWGIPNPPPSPFVRECERLRIENQRLKDIMGEAREALDALASQLDAEAEPDIHSFAESVQVVAEALSWST